VVYSPAVLRAFYFVLFQAVWFVDVWCAARGHGWVGPACVALWVAVQATRTLKPATWLRSLAAVGGLGALTDSLLALTGVVGFAAGTPTTVPPWAALASPGWMIALWVAFGLVMETSMTWLAGRYVLAAVMGGLFAPLSYLAGVRMGALQQPRGLWPMAIGVGAAWALATPAIVRLVFGRSFFDRDGVERDVLLSS
jgi:hypothetical protein